MISREKDNRAMVFGDGLVSSLEYRTIPELLAVIYPDSTSTANSFIHSFHLKALSPLQSSTLQPGFFLFKVQIIYHVPV